MGEKQIDKRTERRKRKTKLIIFLSWGVIWSAAAGRPLHHAKEGDWNRHFLSGGREKQTEVKRVGKKNDWAAGNRHPKSCGVAEKRHAD